MQNSVVKPNAENKRVTLKLMCTALPKLYIMIRFDKPHKWLHPSLLKLSWFTGTQCTCFYLQICTIRKVFENKSGVAIGHHIRSCSETNFVRGYKAAEN